MRQLVAICMLVVAAAVGQAQTDASTPMSEMEVEYDFLKLNMNTGHVERMENATMTLVPEDPAEPAIKISALEATFDYASEEAKTPSRIVFVGKVVVVHPVATITSGRAEWDYVTNVFEFTKNPVATNAKGIKLVDPKEPGGRLVLDFEAGEMSYYGRARTNVGELSGMSGSGKAPDPSLLKESDIANWKGFLETFKAQGAASGPSPGKHILSVLEEKTRAYLNNMPVDELVKTPKDIVKQLNKALKKPEFYDATAWKGIALSTEAKGLLAKKPVAGAELMKRNRLLLEAAYPAFVGKTGA